MRDHSVLTERQRRVLDFILETIRARGIPPTLREIGNHMAIRSTNGVTDHLRALERKGYIVREDTHSRAIKVLRLPPPDHRSRDPLRGEPARALLDASASPALRGRMTVSARVIEVVEVRVVRGLGTPESVTREVTQYWSPAGEFLAEQDACSKVVPIEDDAEQQASRTVAGGVRARGGR